MRKLFFINLLAISIASYAIPNKNPITVWSIGVPDRSAAEFALAPGGFKKFIEHDFGFEDKFFLVGYSGEKKDFPYVLPGPVDTWGGTWPTSGWRTNQVNILFGVEEIPAPGDYTLIIDLTDYAKKFLPLIKVSINNQSVKYQLTAAGYDRSKQKHPALNEPYVDTTSITGNYQHATHEVIAVPVERGVIKKGGNCITIEVLEGSWIMFDDIRLEGDPLKIEKPEKSFVRNVQAATYELVQNGKKVQPLLVNIEHLQGLPGISVELDGAVIFKEKLEKGNYEFEAPMPAVETRRQSKYRILADGKLVDEGVVDRSSQKLQTLADYVDTRIGTGHSRWMIAPGPWMPFGMVKLSPDNQNSGWQAGYQPSYESIGTFSHIHEWTMGGLGIFASNGALKTNIGDEMIPGSGYRSAIDKSAEEALIGSYAVQLKDYDIKAEITATTRCGFMRFTFPGNRDSSRILVDLHIPSEYDYQLKEISVRKINDHRIEGFAHQFSPNVWSRDADQDYSVHFVLEFDQPIKSIGGWINDKVSYGDQFEAKDISNAGFFLQFDAAVSPVVNVRSGISLVSIDN
ncbi:MAG TPA: polysaccharide lyase family protein, partial [Agriterribacter sp.]|nr:polysaccharide lyase family protein [Agriterribacter sp.]